MHPRNTPTKKVDEILREIGLPPEALDEEDVAHINPRRRTVSETECGKQGFASRAEAMRARANRLNKGSNTSFLRAYFCDACKHWHLTSSKRDY